MRITCFLFLTSCGNLPQNTLMEKAEELPTDWKTRWKKKDLPVKITFSSDFTTEERLLFQEKAEAWNQGFVYVDKLFIFEEDNFYEETKKYKLEDFFQEKFQVKIYKMPYWSDIGLKSSHLGVTFYKNFQIEDTNSQYMNFNQALILINTEKFFNDGEYDLMTTLLHEPGHSLGLPHVHEYDAIMYPSIGPREIHHHPHHSELLILNELYNSYFSLDYWMRPLELKEEMKKENLSKDNYYYRYLCQ